MSIAIVLAAVVICVGIVAVAMGRGGELSRPPAEESSVPDFESGVDVARYRPPPALLGYHAGATQRALLQAGRAIADRDSEIGWLRDKLRELQPEGARQDGSLLAAPTASEAGSQPSGPDAEARQPDTGPQLPAGEEE